MQVCKLICPFILVAATFVSICSFCVFSVDSEAIKSLDGSSVYPAALTLQIWYLLMLTREILSTLAALCNSNYDQAFYIVPLTHAMCCCLDIFVMLGFLIWATAVVDTTLIEQCKELPDETGVASFIKATRANIVIGWLYLILHCCACPIFICMLTCCDYFPAWLNTSGARHTRSSRDSEDDYVGQADREQQARNPMEGLHIGSFGSLASSMVKIDDEFTCAICITAFGSDDDVTELTCSDKHIFHTECLKPWLE